MSIDWNDNNHPIYKMGRYAFLLAAAALAAKSTASNFDWTELLMLLLFAIILGFGDLIWKFRKLIYGFVFHLLEFHPAGRGKPRDASKPGVEEWDEPLT